MFAIPHAFLCDMVEEMPGNRAYTGDVINVKVGGIYIVDIIIGQSETVSTVLTRYRSARLAPRHHYHIEACTLKLYAHQDQGMGQSPQRETTERAPRGFRGVRVTLYSYL